MPTGTLLQFKDLGVAAVLAFAAMGSALGTGVAGMAAAGAWKKAFAQNKAAAFIMVAFVGAPLTQTVYGMIVIIIGFTPLIMMLLPWRAGRKRRAIFR